MNLSRPFVRRPIASALIAVAIVLVGALAYGLLPVAPLPQVDFPTIRVSASLPGASPETMASSVAAPLERALGAIAGITNISADCRQGSISIILEFNFDRDIDAAARDVQAAINAARGQLPAGMPGNPTYRKSNPSQAPIMALALSSPNLAPGALYDIAATVLAQKVSQIQGVGEVSVGGSSLPAVRVQLNLTRCRITGSPSTKCAGRSPMPIRSVRVAAWRQAGASGRCRSAISCGALRNICP